MKTCKTCKHFINGSFDYLCGHPNVVEQSRVTGEKRYVRANNVRYDRNLCGDEAKWWEPNRRTRLAQAIKNLFMVKPKLPKITSPIKMRKP